MRTKPQSMSRLVTYVRLGVFLSLPLSPRFSFFVWKGIVELTNDLVSANVKEKRSLKSGCFDKSLHFFVWKWLRRPSILTAAHFSPV